MPLTCPYAGRLRIGAAQPLVSRGTMFGSVILDVAIGMAYIYLLLSLVASVINEALASLVQSRAANLQRGLRSLLSGDSIESGALTLVDNIYNHGLIRGLYQDPAKDYGGDCAKPVERLPVEAAKQLGWASLPPSRSTESPTLFCCRPIFPARTFALAMIDILNKDKFNGKTPIENIERFSYRATISSSKRTKRSKLC